MSGVIIKQLLTYLLTPRLLTIDWHSSVDEPRATELEFTLASGVRIGFCRDSASAGLMPWLIEISR